MTDHEVIFSQTQLVLGLVDFDDAVVHAKSPNQSKEVAAAGVERELDCHSTSPPTTAERPASITESVQIKLQYARSPVRMVDTLFRLLTSTALANVLRQKTSFCTPVTRSFEVVTAATAPPRPRTTRAPSIRLPMICGSRPYFPGAP